MVGISFDVESCQKNHKMEGALAPYPHSTPTKKLIKSEFPSPKSFKTIFIFCISNFKKSPARVSLVWRMGGGILFLSRKFCKLSPPPRPDSLSLTQISRGRGDSSSKRKVSAKILLGKLKEKAEENNQKLKSYFLCWALKFHKYLIIVCYMYFI